MPAKLKLSREEVGYYESLFYSDLSLKAIAKLTKRCSYKVIRPIWLAKFGECGLKERCSRLNRLHKVGAKNPMFGRSGKLHHAFKEIKYDVSGYSLVLAPATWVGKFHRGMCILEHIAVYCKHHNMNELPRGYIIHHIDGCKTNNDISNLIMLTISDHMKLHNSFRKGATTIPLGSTPQESVEAQSIQ